MNLGFKKIGRNLNIATSTAHRVYKIFEQTGAVESRSHPTRENERKLNAHDELYVIGLIMGNPSLYLSEVCHEVRCFTGKYL